MMSFSFSLFYLNTNAPFCAVDFFYKKNESHRILVEPPPPLVACWLNISWFISSVMMPCIGRRWNCWSNGSSSPQFMYYFYLNWTTSQAKLQNRFVSGTDAFLLYPFACCCLPTWTWIFTRWSSFMAVQVANRDTVPTKTNNFSVRVLIASKFFYSFRDAAFVIPSVLREICQKKKQLS
jgi:hypothetical protein